MAAKRGASARKRTRVLPGAKEASRAGNIAKLIAAVRRANTFFSGCVLWAMSIYALAVGLVLCESPGTIR